MYLEFVCPTNVEYFRYADPADCGYYFQCYDGLAYRFKCPPSRVFYQSNGQCDWPVLLQQCPLPGWSCIYSNDIIKFNANFISCLIVHAHATFNQAKLLSNVLFCLDFVCPKNKSGMYSDPKDCRYFYSCTRGVAFHLLCPSGLYFNDNAKLCDLPSRANCKLFGEFVNYLFVNWQSFQRRIKTGVGFL